MSDYPEYQYKVKEREENRRFGFFWWWTNFLRTTGSAIFGAAIVAGVILMLQPNYFNAWLGLDAPVVTAAAPPEPLKVEVATERKGDTVVFPIEGVDAQGRKAAFDVLILTKDYNWVKGSTTEVVKGEEILAEAALLERIFTPEVRDVLGGATDVIAVGVASQEGQAEAEIVRAENRAKTSAAWLGGVAKPEAAIWALNLGQYQTCPASETADTSFQRPLIMIGVKAKDEDANLSEALASAIAGKTNLPSRECYSRFDFAKVR